MSSTVGYDLVLCSNCFIAFFISWAAALTTHLNSSFRIIFTLSSNMMLLLTCLVTSVNASLYRSFNLLCVILTEYTSVSDSFQISDMGLWNSDTV